MKQTHPRDRYNVTDNNRIFDIICDLHVRMLTARDGVKLHTNIYFPADFDNTPSPVLLIRTPYCLTDRLFLPDKRVSSHKVIYILQACRGTGWSEGDFDPTDKDVEKNDVEDLFRWLEKQPWFNGLRNSPGSMADARCSAAVIPDGFNGAQHRPDLKNWLVLPPGSHRFTLVWAVE